jgi:hypothetical protein
VRCHRRHEHGTYRGSQRYSAMSERRTLDVRMPDAMVTAVAGSAHRSALAIAI